MAHGRRWKLPFDRNRKLFRPLCVTGIFYWPIGRSIKKSIFTFGSGTTSWPGCRLILTCWPVPFCPARWGTFAVRTSSRGSAVGDPWRPFSPFAASCSIPAFHSGHSSNSPRHLCHLDGREKRVNVNKNGNFDTEKIFCRWVTWRRTACTPENTQNEINLNTILSENFVIFYGHELLPKKREKDAKLWVTLEWSVSDSWKEHKLLSTQSGNGPSSALLFNSYLSSDRFQLGRKGIKTPLKSRVSLRSGCHQKRDCWPQLNILHIKT